MRNLKKLLAVVLTVVMLASMMVPALAANTYEAEALKLQSIGMFAGEPADLKLEEGVTRIQGLAFAIRAAGVEADAFAMTDEEAETILADYVDGADVPAWGKKYAAYAIKNGITVGVSATEKKFAALDPISGTSFLVFLMKAGMGYADVTTATVVEASVTAGILTAGQAATFGASAALIRDDAAGILYGAAMNGVNADGTPLIEALIASGFVDADAALAAGFVVEVEPEDLEVVSVEAINLKQIVVTLSNTDYDKDDVEDEANYKFKGVVNKKDKTEIAISNASVDGTELTLTLAGPVDNQSEGVLTLKKDVVGVEVDVEEIEFFDTTIPTIVDAQVIGKDTIKVKFSEPINFEETAPTLGAALEAKVDYEKEFTFKLNGKSYSVDKIFVLDNGATANVKVFGSFKEGLLTMKVDNGLEDYAGFNLVSKTIELDVVEDKDAPIVVGYEDAELTGITLIFDEDIELKKTAVTDYYHTNSNNGIDAGGVSVDGNKLKLKFTGNKLPEGTAYIYIKSEAVADLWGNKNDSTIKYLVEVTLDETAPEVKEIKATSASVKVTFTEELDEGSAEKIANYTILDSDGDKVSLRRADYAVNKDDEGVVTITPRSALDDGVYTIEIENVEDDANNVMDDFSDEFTLDDETAPGIDGAYLSVVDFADDEYEITVLFDEEMAVDGKYSVLDLANYTIDGETLEWYDGEDDYTVEIEAIDGNETVVITIEGLALAVNNGTDAAPAYAVLAGKPVVVGRVADAAGNYTGLTNPVALAMKSSTSIALDSAKATGKKIVEVKFANNLQNPEVQDFIVQSVDGTATYDIESLDIIDSDEIILNLDKELPADVLGATGVAVPDDIAALIVKTVAKPDSENSSGIALAGGATVAIADEIALSVLEEDNVDTSLIYGATGDDGDDDEVEAVYAEYDFKGTPITISADIVGTSKIRIIFDEAIATYIAGNTGLFKVNGGDNKVTGVAIETNNILVLTVDGEVVKGDSIDITAIYDIVGNSAKNLALNIEYVVEDVCATEVQAKADSIALTLAANGAVGTEVMPDPGAGFTIEVKTSSDPTIYDLDGKIVANGTSNVVYTVTNTESGYTADTGIVVVTVTAT